MEELSLYANTPLQADWDASICIAREEMHRRSVLVIDDHEIARRGLRGVFADLCSSTTHIVEAGTLQQAIAVCSDAPHSFALAIMDLGLPDSRGFKGLSTFRRHFPSVRLAALANVAHPILSAEAISAGADRVIHKSASCSEFEQLLGWAQNTSSWIRTGIARPVHRPGQLNPRQIQILDLLLDGKSNQEIGDELQMSLSSVKNSISMILSVFGESSRAKLMRLFS